jgi:phage terminase large subunit-like protein
VGLEPFTLEHFVEYAKLLVYDDDSRRVPEPWQLRLAEDLFRRQPDDWPVFKRHLWIVPEGNGKTTFTGLLALYGADYTSEPWIPIGASSAKQAKIMYQQAAGFVRRTPGMADRFECLDGIKLIRSLRNPGPGIEIYAHDPKTGDGVIPAPYALVDELHRHPDMRLWRLWGGKLRKRRAQIIGISTGGEPETEFENMRDSVRRRAREKQYEGAYLRAEGNGEVLHEWMVLKDEDCSDMEQVKDANPLSTITVATLTEDFELVEDLGEWKRLKCNRPTRSTESAITDKEWDDAQTDEEIPAGASIDVGLDIAFKWDTTAAVPLWKGPKFRLLGEAKILKPPRDGSSMHPDVIKDAMLSLADDFRVDTVVMDMERAADIAHWIEDELGVTVIDRQQGNKFACADYEAFMDGLRNGTVKHTGDPGLRSHVLHAIARRLPGGDRRFDRPAQSRRAVGEQDRRVIDALTAAAMVVEHSTSAPPRKSVYAERRELFASY